MELAIIRYLIPTLYHQQRGPKSHYPSQSVLSEMLSAAVGRNISVAVVRMWEYRDKDTEGGDLPEDVCYWLNKWADNTEELEELKRIRRSGGSRERRLKLLELFANKRRAQIIEEHIAKEDSHE